MLTVELGLGVGGCTRVGVLALGHVRRRWAVADVPVFRVPVRSVWLARL